MAWKDQVMDSLKNGFVMLLKRTAFNLSEILHFYQSRVGDTNRVNTKQAKTNCIIWEVNKKYPTHIAIGSVKTAFLQRGSNRR